MNTCHYNSARADVFHMPSYCQDCIPAHCDINSRESKSIWTQTNPKQPKPCPNETQLNPKQTQRHPKQSQRDAPPNPIPTHSRPNLVQSEAKASPNPANRSKVEATPPIANPRPPQTNCKRSPGPNDPQAIQSKSRSTRSSIKPIPSDPNQTQPNANPPGSNADPKQQNPSPHPGLEHIVVAPGENHTLTR